MMTKEELLKAQQSLLQSEMDINRGKINFWKEFHLDGMLHKKQYALSKILKMVEKEISYEAMLKRQGRAFDSFIISQPYEEEDEPYVSEEAFKQKLQERMVQAMMEGAQLRGEYE